MGPNILIRVALLFALFLPWSWMVRLSGLVGRAAARFSPARSVVKGNLAALQAWKRTLRGAEAASGSSVRVSDVYASYGRYWGELLSLAARPRQLESLPIRVEGEVHLLEAVKAGPVCCVTGHLGNWDLGARWMARRLQPFAVLAEPLRPSALHRFFRKVREQAGCVVIPSKDSGVRVYRHLRKGGHLGIVGDRDLGGGARLLPFLGGQRAFPASGLELARKAGASFLPTFLLREKGEYVMKVYPPLGREEDPTEGFVRILGDEVARNPDQWLVLYPLHQGQGSAGEGVDVP